MSSYAGHLLRVNLSRGSVSKEPILQAFQRKFVGGRGFGIGYLFEEIRQGTDSLGEENKLILMAGALAGTSARGFGRWIAMTKSPLTGAIARAVGGGNFAAYIRFAGYDLIILEGKAEKPSLLIIDGNRVEIKDASELWGLDTQKTQDAICQKYGARAQTACIGPAGERLVRYATITHGTRTASRCGVGTVMGSKNLKALTILAKASPPKAANEALFRELNMKHGAILKDHKRRVKMHKFGTTFLAVMTREMGILPVKNFQMGDMEGIENLFTEAYQKMRIGSHGCYNCVTRCGQVHKVKDGPYVNSVSEGPEYETIWAFGSQVGNTDAGATVEADRMCDLLGLDTISTGSSIGFAMELYQRGIISNSDTDGMELKWGDTRSVMSLIRKIAYREGFGNLLGEGTRRAADIIGKGAYKYAIHCKGLELPAYEPRAAKIHGLSMATSNIGGSHMYGYACQEISGKDDPRPVDRFADHGYGDVAAYNQICKALEETGILCNFADSGMNYELLGGLLASATGFPEFEDLDYLKSVGERIVTLERCFNVREGFSRKDDTLPERMLTEPLANAGPATGEIVRNQDALLDEYYAALGCNSLGIPSEKRLRELDLADLKMT